MKYKKTLLVICGVILMLLVAVIFINLDIKSTNLKSYAIQLPKSDFNVNQNISEEYYKQRVKHDNMKLYEFGQEHFFIQIPDNAIVLEGVHADGKISFDTSTINLNEAIVSITYCKTASQNVYETIEDVIESYRNDGIILQGNVTNFNTYKLTDDISECKFSQIFDSGQSIEHMLYYIPDGQIGVTVQCNDSDEGSVTDLCIESIWVK